MTWCSCLQIFLTANPKLRSEVAKQFHRLRAAILRDSEESKRLEELSKQDYSSLKDIPSDAFPLFWTTKQYLRAVDATLPEAPLGAGPFFPRYRLPAAADTSVKNFNSLKVITCWHQNCCFLSTILLKGCFPTAAFPNRAAFYQQPFPIGAFSEKKGTAYLRQCMCCSGWMEGH